MKKKAKNKILSYPMFILIATLLMGIGYAAINAISLDVVGTLSATLPQNVFI